MKHYFDANFPILLFFIFKASSSDAHWILWSMRCVSILSVLKVFSVDFEDHTQLGCNFRFRQRLYCGVCYILWFFRNCSWAAFTTINTFSILQCELHRTNQPPCQCRQRQHHPRQARSHKTSPPSSNRSSSLQPSYRVCSFLRSCRGFIVTARSTQRFL